MMDYGHEWTDKELKALEARIAAEYRQAANEIKAKLDKYLEKFKAADAQKRKDLKAGLITQKEYLDWRQGQLMTGKRWQEMLNNLAHDLQNTNKIANSMARKFSFDAYAMNFNFGTYEAEIGAGISTAFTLYNREAVERLVRDDPDLLPPPGAAVSEAIAEGRAELWNKRRIQSVMTQSILQGESIPNIAKRLAEEVSDSNMKAAIRNARTMTTGAENAGRIDSYKRAESKGIDIQQMWIATLDNRTRHEHRQLDRQKVNVGEDFHYGIYKLRFPGDPHGAPFLVYNCRCGVIGIVDGMGLEERLDKMEKEGKTKEGLSYDEWKNGKPEYGKDGKPKTPEAPEKPESNWIDEINTIKANSNRTPDDIKRAGQIIANQIQPVKDEYIKSIADIAKEKEDALSDYYSLKSTVENLGKARSPIKSSMSNLDGRLMDAKYKDWPEYKKMALDKHLKRFGIDIDILDNDDPIAILGKMDIKYNSAVTGYNDAIKRYNDADTKLSSTWVNYANALKAKLSEVRDMGIPDYVDISKHLSGNREMKKCVVSAYDYYPTTWITNSINSGNLKVKKVGRGYYDHFDSAIAISGNGDARSTETAIHELGHRFERTQGLLQHEQKFYDERTKGEPLKWLGGNYRKNELTRKDDFVEAYMGKDYHGTSYELCSMGFEYAYTHPELLAKDPDMESWILGMLAVE